MKSSSLPNNNVTSPVYIRKSFESSPPVTPAPAPAPPAVVEEKKSMAPEIKTETKPVELTDNKESQLPSKDPVVKADDKKVIDKSPVQLTSNKSSGSNFSLISSSESQSQTQKREKDNSNDQYNPFEQAIAERKKKDLEEKLKNVQSQMDELGKNSNKSTGDSKELQDLMAKRKKLENDIAEAKNANRNSNSNSGSQRNWNKNNGDGANSNMPWDNLNNPVTKNNTHNDYDKGHEFDAEKSRKELDDGSKNFDPEEVRKPASAAGGKIASEAAAKSKNIKAGMNLTNADGKAEEAEDLDSAFLKGKKKGKKSGNFYQEELANKCGTGAVLKCVFPNSYFVDPEYSDLMYTTIANLKLEGRRFQTLEKVRPSKKSMKMGEKVVAKYYVNTYDLVLTDKNRGVTDEERDQIYKEIKENRKDLKFKKKLIQYRYMTKVGPSKMLLSDHEAKLTIEKSITPEEYEQLGFQDD